MASIEKEKPVDPRLHAVMNNIAERIGMACPPGFGFALLMFDLDSKHGRMNYVSNARRADMLRAMKEFVAKNEAEHGSAQ